MGEILAVPSLGVNPANGRRMLQKADGTVVQYKHLGSGWTTLDGKATTAPTQLADGVYYGPVLPTWYGGLDNTFRYRAIDLGVFVQFSGGNYIYNGTKAGLHDQRFWNNQTDILTTGRPTTPMPSLAARGVRRQRVERLGPGDVVERGEGRFCPPAAGVAGLHDCAQACSRAST